MLSHFGIRSAFACMCTIIYYNYLILTCASAFYIMHTRMQRFQLGKQKVEAEIISEAQGEYIGYLKSETLKVDNTKNQWKRDNKG